MEPDGGGYTDSEYDKWEKYFQKFLKTKQIKTSDDIIKDFFDVNISGRKYSFLFLAIKKVI